ncbi:MAG TPA: sodium/solute symporter [Terriglobales bacterium]|nr:sodium/solute symporter [Terriglobales bacterium]
MNVNNFGITEWAILGGYIAAISIIGSLFYRKKTSTGDFFLGGRNMRALPVAISLVAADMSAISYMGAPAWTYQNNLELVWSSWTYLFVAPAVMFLFMPFYSRFKFFTAYEYLERRFDLKTRLVGSAIFMLLRGSHVAIVIYAPSLVLSLITGLPLWGCILMMGVCTTLYTTLGGMRAVIWTDVLQFSILIFGLITVVSLSISHVPGGLRAVVDVSERAGRFHLFNFSTDLTQITTFWAAAIGGGFMALSTLGTDQAYLQRYFTTRSLKEGRKSILLDAIILVPVSLMLYLVGPVLYAFYEFHPQSLQGLPSMDAILPFFVVNELGGWFSGLIIASIFAASMAVMSAGINALTTATTVDFYKRLFRPNCSDSETVFVGRVGTVGWGAAATLAALFADRLGPIINAFNMINSFLGGPVLGMFLLGMLTKRTRGTSAIGGSIIGLLSVSLLAWQTEIAFFYYAIVGTFVTFGAGWLFGFLQPARDESELSGLVLGLDLATPKDA